MKNLIVLLICTIAFNAIADYGSVGKSNSKGFNGSVQSDSVEKQFINVQNKLGSTISAGMLAVWDVSNDDGASVTTSATRTSVPACIMVKDCASNAFCKCQTYGYNASVLFDSTAGAASASGKMYISSETAGYISARAPLSSEQIGGIQAAGFFYDTPSASAAVEAFIKLR